MRILLDHCVAKRLRRLLAGHEVRTAYELGLAGVENGRLLARAAGDFDLVITLDQRIVHQQNLKALPVAVLVLVVPNNSWPVVRALAGLIMEAIPTIEPRTLTLLHSDGRRKVVGGTTEPRSR